MVRMVTHPINIYFQIYVNVDILQYFALIWSQLRSASKICLIFCSQRRNFLGSSHLFDDLFPMFVFRWIQDVRTDGTLQLKMPFSTGLFIPFLFIFIQSANAEFEGKVISELISEAEHPFATENCHILTIGLDRDITDELVSW